MPKEELTGTLEEQCDFLYALAVDKMAQGNFTGAAHVLKEIVKYAPDYPGAQELLAEARQRKAEQRTLVLLALLGLSVGVFVGSTVGVANDLLLFVYAGAGALGGYAFGNLFYSYRRS